jgi:hypothetical protein
LKTIGPDTFLKLIWPTDLLRDESLELRRLRREDNTIEREFLSSREAFVEKALEYSESGWDVYMGVATRFKRGGKKRDCLRVKTVWVDIDKTEVPSFGDIQPDIIVRSGKGSHVYFLLKSPVFIRDGRWREIEAVNRALIKKFGGDIGALDVSRILRVPGTLNYKYDPPRKVQAYVRS